MSTLENLKTHGKTVGVISHVEGVRTRIKTQIELIKKPNGFSELKMVA
jgi:exonuclease SbcC